MKKAFITLTAILLVVITACPTMLVFAQSAADKLADNGLPVVNITIDESASGYGTIEQMNSSPDHSVKCTGTVKITVPEGYTGDYSDLPLSDTGELKLDYIRGRGHTTWMNDKKPYKLKLDKKADLLGMGRNKHWALLANYFDSTLLRNKIVSYMGSELGLAYTPKMLPVDVVMNGEYLGSYFLSEQVRVDENRVEIDELTNEDNSEPEITGGYLISMKPYGNEPELNRFYTERGVGFLFDTPEFASDDPADKLGTAAQREYIADYLQKAENAIYNGDPGKYMDLQSTIDYWWVQTFTFNYDAYFTDSTYLYKPRNDKLYWGPLWDFDLSLGKTITQTEGFGVRDTPWLDYLRENDPGFRELLKDRWAAVDGIITDIVKPGGVLDSYKAEIKRSWEANAPYAGDKYADFEFEMESLRTWMTERQEWINGNLDLIGKVHSSVSFNADGETLEQHKILTGLPLTALPQAPEKDGYLFIGWEYEGERLNPYNLPAIWKDAVINAVYLSDDEVIRADHIYFSEYDVWADIGENMYYTLYTVTPEDAHDKKVTWSTSDSDIAEVNSNGVVTMKQIGEVTVTASLSQGFSTSYKLHIYDGNETQLKEPESITLKQSTITMRVGEYAQIVADSSPKPCESMFDYYCDDSDIIEILDNGVVKALSPGTATVSVVLKGIEAVCTVIVTDGNESSTEPETVPEPTRPMPAATERQSSATDDSVMTSGGAVSTGGASAAPVLLLLIVSAAVIALLRGGYRKGKEK